MVTRNVYTIEEDVCIAESLLENKLVFTGPGLTYLRVRLPKVHKLFKEKTRDYGIDGSLRTLKSIEARVYLLRDAVRRGRIHRHRDGRSNPLAERRVRLWSRVFGVRAPSTSQPRHAVPRSAQQLEASVREEGKQGPSMDRTPSFQRVALPGKTQKQNQKHMDAKRLLHVLNSIHKQRNEIKVKREENIRRQQEIDQIERRCMIAEFERILGNVRKDGEIECFHFLTLLEDIAESDAKLCLLRERNVQDRIENDREYGEWERSAFEKLMKRYFG